MIIHLPTIPLSIIMLGFALCDFEFGARNHYVGGVGAAAPFLTRDAVA